MLMQVTAEHAVNLLNDLLARDPRWMRQVFSFVPRCNAEVANHPTVQVRRVGTQFHSAGILGILNGLFGIYTEGSKAGYGPVTAVWSEDGKDIIRFEVTKNVVKGA